MAQNDRLRVKRGDTARGFRARCLDADSPADLTGAQARLLLRGDVTGGRSLALTVEAGTDGWVKRTPWQAGDLALVESARGEVEVTYADGTIQTFPGGGYFTLEILGDLG